jgi:membrane associated rhomboid family serine protease
MFSFLNNIPVVTKNILLINVALYFLMLVSISTGGFDLTNYLSTHYVGTPFFEPYQVVTHMFMHSSQSIFHIFFNMFMLVMFGSHLERLWGAKHFFIFYFACGFGAFALDNIVHGMEIYQLKSKIIGSGMNIAAVEQYIETCSTCAKRDLVSLAKSQEGLDSAWSYLEASFSVGVGASGAIFGLLAAFGILFANTELYLMFIPVPVKAKYLIGLYVLYEAYRAFNPIPGDPTNHWAHLGGAIVGAAIVLIRRKTNRTNFY